MSLTELTEIAPQHWDLKGEIASLDGTERTVQRPWLKARLMLRAAIE